MNSYRSPMENFVDLLDSEKRTELREDLYGNIKALSSKEWNLYSFAMSKTAASHLIEHGIPLHPNGCLPHPHPVCKTIETFMLHSVVKEVLKTFLRDGFKIKVCSMKEQKFQALKKSLKDFRSNEMSLFNKIFEARDVIRYGSNWPESSKIKSYCSYLNRTRTPNSVLFLHDEIHHFTMDQISQFLSLTKPKHLVATAIFPVELMFGSEISLNPHLYEFDLRRDKLLFYPDGKTCGHYEQLKDWDLLRYSGLQADVHYSVDVIRTLGAHHVLVLSRGRRNVCLNRTFGDFACFNPTLDKNLFVRPCKMRMRSKALKKYVLYMLSLKKPDVESAVAKLRQLSDDDIDPLELPFVMAAAKVLCGKTLDFQERFFETIRNWVDQMAIESKVLRKYIPNDAKMTSFRNMIGSSFQHKFIVELNQDFTLKQKLDSFTERVVDKIEKGLNKGGDHINEIQELFGVNEEKRLGHYDFDGKVTNILKTLKKDQKPTKAEGEVTEEETTLTACSEKDEDVNSMPDLEVCPSCEEDVDLILRDALEDFGSQTAVTEKEESISPGEGECDVLGLFEQRWSGTNICGGFEPEAPKSQTEIIKESQGSCSTPALTRQGSSVIMDRSTSCELHVLTVFEDRSLLSYANLLKFPDKVRHGFAGFYAFPGIDRYSYNGGSHASMSWQPFLDEILEICGFTGRFNSCLAQTYTGDHRALGLHSDDEQCYEKDHEVLTVNLLGDAKFLIEGSRCHLRRECKTTLWLQPGFYFLMPRGFQRDHKHGVRSSSEGRISLTFRLQRMDPKCAIDQNSCHSLNSVNQKIPEVLFHDVLEKVLKGENQCLIFSIAQGLEKTPAELVSELLVKDEAFWLNWVEGDCGADDQALTKISSDLSLYLVIASPSGERAFGNKDFGAHIRLDADFNHLRFDKRLDGHKMDDNYSDFTSYAFEFISNFDNSTKFTFSPSFKDADILRRSLLQRKEGVISEKFFRPRLEKMREVRYAAISGLMISGLPGSGKSKSLESFLKGHQDKRIAIVTPRVELKKQWMEGLEIQDEGVKNRSNSKISVQTFETAIGADFQSCELVVFDEIFLFPGGYLDLIFYLNPGILNKVICLGDPLQSSHFSLGSIELRTASEFLEKVSFKGKLKYRFFSYRMNEEMGKFMPFPCLGRKKKYSVFLKVFDGIESMLHGSKDDLPDAILVGSFEDKSLFPKAFPIPVMTFGESQGTTFDKTCILMSTSTFKSDNFRQFVAITRSRSGSSFINMTGRDRKVLTRAYPNSILIKFLNGEISRGMVDSMFVMRGIRLDDLEEIKEATTFGNTAEEKLSGDPWLKPYLFLGQIPNAEICRYKEPIPPEPESKTHLPLCPENFDFASVFEKMRAKEFREARVRYDMSSQFIDIQRDRGMPACQPMLFEAIYPRHKATDDVTFWMAVKKRLRWSKPEVEKELYRKNYKFGQVIFDNFLKFVKLDPEFEDHLLNNAQNDFELAKLKKDAATIENHAMRSCKDWDNENIFLFMKSQHCTKLDKEFCDAKAGQTLACFNHLVLCHFSKWCRYIDAKVQKALDSSRDYNFYIHTRKNFEQLNHWVKNQDFSGVCTESDYEAFDASQDSIVLAFEVCLMKFLRFPQDIIHSYEQIKFHLRCKLGHFAIMRFTGEFCTFLFNTLSNMAFTFMRYKIEKGVSIAFAGDDMCASRRLELSGDYEYILDELSLKAKVGFTPKPTFCGWFLSGYGIVKSPKLIWNRFRVANERDNLKDCLESYAIEACYAYELGDRLFEILDEENLHYYQAINRLVIKKLDQISPNIRTLFSRAFANIRNGYNTGEQGHQGIQEFWESDGSDSIGLNIP